jgi:hypothetical protein
VTITGFQGFAEYQIKTLDKGHSAKSSLLSVFFEHSAKDLLSAKKYSAKKNTRQS